MHLLELLLLFSFRFFYSPPRIGCCIGDSREEQPCEEKEKKENKKEKEKVSGLGGWCGTRGRSGLDGPCLFPL
jgi:hypothetical protein